MKAVAKIRRKVATERKSIRVSRDVMSVVVQAHTTASARIATAPID